MLRRSRVPSPLFKRVLLKRVLFLKKIVVLKRAFPTPGKESKVLLVTLSILMDAKMEEPISHVKGWVNGQIAITAARSYSRMIRGARVPSPLRTREPDWDSGSGLDLAQYISRAKIVLRTPAHSYPFESNPPVSFTLRATRFTCATQRHPLWRTDGMALTGTLPDAGFGVKGRPFGEEHGYFGV